MTKKDIVDQTAKELFWKYGFKKISIDEICKKSNVSRKTFYTYYKNKNQLIIALIDVLMVEMFELFETLIADESKPFSVQLAEMMALKQDLNKQFSLEFVSDFYHPDSSEVLEYFQTISSKAIALTYKFFERAQQRGEMNPNLDLKFVMWYMQKQLELVQSPEINTIFSDTQNMTKQISELLIYGIMKPQAKPLINE